MKLLIRYCCCLIALFQSGAAIATRPGDYAFIKYMPLVLTCAAQDGSYSRVIWNGMMHEPPGSTAQDREETERTFNERLVMSPWATCVRQRQWVSTSLCSAIAAAMSQREQDIRPALNSHREEVAELQHVFVYHEAAYFSKIDDPPCPKP